LNKFGLCYHHKLIINGAERNKRQWSGERCRGNVCQCSGALSITVARSGAGKDEMNKGGVIHHCNTLRSALVFTLYKFLYRLRGKYFFSPSPFRSAPCINDG